MSAALSILLAVSFTIGPANTIKYPEWAVDPVTAKYIPYPLFDAHDASTGGWLSGRITDKLGTAMFGSLDAILQRRIIPCWYPWGMGRTLTVDAVCSADFMQPVPSKAKDPAGFEEFICNRLTSPLFFATSYDRYVAAATAGDDYEWPDPLGIYSYATNRDFSKKSTRISAANAAADYAITNEMVGLVASLDVTGDSAAHYWVNPASLEGLTSTDFAFYALPHDGWEKQILLFLGDYATTNYLPPGLFSRSAYQDLRDLNPSWSRKFYASKGYPTFRDIFTEERERLGGRITNCVSSLINGGHGVGLIKNTYRKNPTPRIVLDRFALLNSAASLCQTAFLGTRVCAASQLEPYSWYSKTTTYPTQPVPDFKFLANEYSGHLIYSNDFPTTVKFVPSIDSAKPEAWTAQFDVSSMLSSVKGSDIAFKTADLDVSTGIVHSVTAAWYDETAYAALRTWVRFDLKRSNFTVTVPTTHLLDNPFADDPAAAQWNWTLDTIVGTGGEVSWILNPAEPGAVFSDGSTSKVIGHGVLSFKDTETVPLTFQFSWRLGFKGRDLPHAICPFIGPTCLETPLSSASLAASNSVMSVTYAPQVYAAGLVETWIDAYTSVGLSAHRDDAVKCHDEGAFDILSSIDDRTWVYSKYAAAPYHVGSTVGWQNAWKNIYTPGQIENDVTECVGHLNLNVASSSAATETYYPSMATCLAGYGGDATAEASFAKVKAKLAGSGEGVFPASFSITPRSITITNGEIPYDFVCGSLALTINIPVAVDDARRSSVAVGYQRQGLPFAKWKFPAMDGVEEETQ